MVAHPCQAPLPHGPRVPAPIVFRTSCGGFRLGTSGAVVRLPRHWLAKRSGGTGRRFGADIQVRRTRPGSFVLGRHGRVFWRSRGLYPNDGGAVAFGPGEFAFGTYRDGVFLTDLRGPERLVLRGRALFPIDFTRGGQLLVSTPRALVVVGRNGKLLRRYRYRRTSGFAFDTRTDTLLFVTLGGRLAAARWPRVQLRGTAPDGWLSLLSPRLLAFQSQSGFIVTRRDGSRVAGAQWPAHRSADAGIAASPDGRRFAFRLTHRRTATVYVLAAGGRPRVVYRHRLGRSGCAVGAGLGWNGPFLLYESTDGHLALLDSRRRTARDLRPFARRLPHLGREAAQAWWRAELD